MNAERRVVGQEDSPGLVFQAELLLTRRREGESTATAALAAGGYEARRSGGAPEGEGEGSGRTKAEDESGENGSVLGRGGLGCGSG